MNRKHIRRIFWPLFIGVAVAALATKTAYPSLQISLLRGIIAASYILAFMYAVTECNAGARVLRACVTTATVLYIAYIGTGLVWSLIPWGIILFTGACIFFLRYGRHSE